MSILPAPSPARPHRGNQPKAALRLSHRDRTPSAAPGHSGLHRSWPAMAAARPLPDGSHEPGLLSAEPAPAVPLGPRGKCITVLLAEERTIVRQGIDALLAIKPDIAVIGQAPDCRQAFELAEKLRPDVVIIAISMALRNGPASLRRMLAASGGSRVLVLVPHNDNNAFVAHVAASGAAGCVTEQASSQLLATAVREAYETSGFFGQGAAHPAETQLQPLHRWAVAEKENMQLTPREREVLQLIAEGNANKQTAFRLGISIKTVEKHRQHLMDKLGIHETATLTRYAVYAGIAA